MRTAARIILYLPLAVLLGCWGARVETGPGAGLPSGTLTADYVPAGTRLDAELNQTLTTRQTEVGDAFTASLEQSVVTAGGALVIPHGAVLHGRVTGLHRAQGVGGQAAIRLNFETISFGGSSYPLSATILDAHVQARPDLRDVGEKAAIGAAAGAALGVIIKGDLEGLLSGAILGAAAGTIISLGTSGVDAALPAGTVLILETTSGIRIR
jgi:hypothetical protein